MDRNLILDGTPWWVNFQFSAGTLATPKELVRPKYNLTVSNNIDGKQIKENNRLIILGIAYSFHTAANGGVNLYWQYDDYLGTTIVNIAQVVCGTANASIANGYETFLPGVAGRIEPNGGIFAPASLFLSGVGTYPTLGHFKVWGIHVDASWRVGKQFGNNMTNQSMGVNNMTVGGTNWTGTNGGTLNFNTATLNN